MTTSILLAVDVLAIAILTFGLYFPRHRRKDMVVAYLVVNLGLVAVTSALSATGASIGLGFGLFAVLSIIRLRSDELDQQEVAYYFAALALGLLGGLALEPIWLGPALMGLILAALAIGDSPALFARYRVETLRLDSAYTDERELIERLEEMLGARPPHQGPPRRSRRSHDHGRGALRGGAGRRASHRRALGHSGRRGAEVSAANLGQLVTPLPPVTLADLDARAALLTRRDRKYLVPWSDADWLVRSLEQGCRVLEIEDTRAFGYQSVYFDTPHLESYLAAARRRPRRFKVRTRSYLDSGLCQLEIKTRSRRGETVKRRVAHPFDRGHQLDAADLDFVAACPLIGGSASDLRPILTTHYTRATLLLEADVRVTVDVGLHAEGPDGRMVVLPDTAVIETKSGGPPTEADRLLWRLGHRPLKVSKFGTSLSVLYPQLPGNKWTRARRWPWVEEPLSAARIAGLPQAS